MVYVVLPLLVVGIPTGFIGTVWWARQLKPATRIATALVLLFLCVLIFFPQPNIHGAGGLLIVQAHNDLPDQPARPIPWTLGDGNPNLTLTVPYACGHGKS